MDADCKLISCSVYDVLEAAAVSKKRMIVVIADLRQEIVIDDIYAKGNEEFLDGHEPSGGQKVLMRLDQIDLLIDPSENQTFLPKQW